MAGAELKIVLVGDDPDQQAALNRDYQRDRQAGDTAARHAGPEVAITGSLDALAKKIEELIDLDRRGGGSKPEKPSEPEKDNSFMGRMLARLDRVAGALENFSGQITSRVLGKSAGRAVSAVVGRARRVTGKALGSVGRRIAQTRVGRAVGGMLARRGAAAAAGTAAAGAGGAAGAAGGAGGGAAAGAAAALGPVGVAAAGATVALAGAAITVKLFSDAMSAAADTLEDLSPDIARVRGQQSARMEMARLGRAQATGAGLAELEAARGRIAESTYELQTRILEILLKFSPLVEGVLDGVNVGVRGVDAILAEIGSIWSQVNDIPLFGDNGRDNQAAAQRLKDATDALSVAVKQLMGEGPARQDQGIDPFFHDVLGMAGTGPARQMPPNIGNFP